MPSQRRIPAKKAAPRRAPSAHEAQAAVEGVVVPADRKVSLLGAEFKMADRIGLAPLILLAVAGKKGADAADMDGLAALHDVISDCLDESEHDRFWRHAVACKADGDDLQQVVKDVMEANAARPTRSPGGSSAGRRTTSANSKASSSRTGTESPPGMVSGASLLGR